MKGGALSVPGERLPQSERYDAVDWEGFRYREYVGKRALDIAGASCALLVLSPLLAIVALVIPMDSPGPAFYRGVRTGRYGRPFRMWKFRTMVVGASSAGKATAQGDPRITRLGALLRASKVDELPQLLNVVTGDMSLVGPRPENPEYTDRYRPEEMECLVARPGITDLSSIHYFDQQAHLGAEDAEGVYLREVLPRKNALRVQYVREQSFRRDIGLLVGTAKRLLLRR